MLSRLYLTPICKIQELAEYIARSRPESDRQAFTSTFEEALKTGDGQTPLEKDTGRRQRIISQVVDSVDGLGEGSDKGVQAITLEQPNLRA